MDRLYDKLNLYSKEDYYPMHMPGHKRNTELLPMGNPYEIDITEIEGFDNLHQSEGILKQLSLRISSLYRAEKSYPLVNGSTAGILAGISSATNKGDKILMARNSHKSVYHAVILRELEPVYIYPQKVPNIPVNGGIPAAEVEEMLIKHQDIKLVVITSPTYEGIVSDISEIAKIVHKYGAILLVDEAHGAHFGFHEHFPKSAITLGADIIIQSLHKTLPAFTQTAVLHSNKAELNHQIEKHLSIFQSSSPSYLLLAGMDRCISLLEDSSKMLFDAFYDKLETFQQALDKLTKLTLLDRRIIGRNGIYDLDSSKITVFTGETTYTGHQLSKILSEKFKIVMEMEAKDYILAMTSICDTKEGFDRLEKALLTIDGDSNRIEHKPALTGEIKTKMDLLPFKAVECKTEEIKLIASCGRVSAVFISLFPPGSPLLVPGEIINKEILDFIDQAFRDELTITGLHGFKKDEIEVVCTSQS